ncbi:hypothetical protein ACF0H5_019040 [Mactra antiquata]
MRQRRAGSAPRLASGILPGRSETVFTFITPLGFVEPHDSRTCWTPWSVFQDGSGGGPTETPQTIVPSRRTSPCQGAVAGHGRSRASTVEHPSTARGQRRRHHPRSQREPTSAALTLAPEGESYLAAGLMTAPEPVVAFASQKVHPPEDQVARHRRPVRDRRGQAPASGRAEFREATKRVHPFDSMRFHVLLNSLFKVLFNFPSRYLSAIGLVPVFSLRRSLPPA